MSEHPVMPHLVALLRDFLGPIHKKKRKGKRASNAFNLARKQRDLLVVFLRNFIGQIFESEFHLPPPMYSPQESAKAYSQLQKWLRKNSRDRKGHRSLVALAEAMAPILNDWLEIEGTSYVINDEIYPQLIKQGMPRLLSATLTYAKEIKDGDLVEELQAVVLLWGEVFSERSSSRQTG